MSLTAEAKQGGGWGGGGMGRAPEQSVVSAGLPSTRRPATGSATPLNHRESLFIGEL